MKKCSLVKVLFLILFCVGVANAAVSWEYIWNADEMPELFLGGTVFSHGAYVPADTDLVRSIDNGVYTTETMCLIPEAVSPNANSSFITKTDIFDPSVPNTIEFKYRADKELKPYIHFFMISQEGVGDLGFNFRASHQILNRYSGGQNFVAYKNLEGWSVFRVLTTVSAGNLTGASIYYKNGDGDWVLGMTVSLYANAAVAASQFQFGDGGSNWAGQWSVDYFNWTSEGATLDPIVTPVVATNWDYAWQADEMPEAFVAGSVLINGQYMPAGTTVIRDAVDGIYTFETTATDETGATNANCSFKTGINKFNPLSPSTIEFRYKAEISVKPYISCLWLNIKDMGEIHFNFLLNHQVRDGRTGVNFTAYKDAQGWSTFRLLTNVTDGVFESADMYYKDAGGNWVFGLNAPFFSLPTIATNDFWFGDGGGNWAGKCSLDYFYWTSAGATLDELDILASPIRSDLDDDGDVDLDDFSILASKWLTGAEV